MISLRYLILYYHLRTTNYTFNQDLETYHHSFNQRTTNHTFNPDQGTYHHTFNLEINHTFNLDLFNHTFNPELVNHPFNPSFSISVGPSGLATHCVLSPVLFPTLETTFLKTKTGLLDMELEMDGYG